MGPTTGGGEDTDGGAGGAGSGAGSGVGVCAAALLAHTTNADAATPITLVIPTAVLWEGRILPCRPFQDLSLVYEGPGCDRFASSISPRQGRSRDAHGEQRICREERRRLPEPMRACALTS